MSQCYVKQLTKDSRLCEWPAYQLAGQVSSGEKLTLAASATWRIQQMKAGRVNTRPALVFRGFSMETNLATLFSFFYVQCHATEAAIVFLELEFLPARSAQKHVVDITSLLANEERGFLFLLALGHFMRTYLQQKLRSWTFRNAYYG